jgi:hypothetical protein
LRWDDFAKTDIVAAWARNAGNPAPMRREWVDEWGCRWETLDTTAGHVVGHPIASAADYAAYRLPEPQLDLTGLRANRAEYPDRACSGGLSFFFFERLEKLREFREAMMDLAAEREALEAFLDRLQAHYIAMVDAYAASGTVDIICVNEDLGLQDRLTISPAMWRERFKPRYQAVYNRAHEHGLLVFQHTCGYVQDIITDLAEIGVDILELQQLNCVDMGTPWPPRGAGSASRRPWTFKRYCRPATGSGSPSSNAGCSVSLTGRKAGSCRKSTATYCHWASRRNSASGWRD